MVWESYPIIWINIAYLAIISAYYWLIKKLICRFEHITLCSDQSRARYFATVTIVTLLVFGGLFGKLSQYPLRWSDAFFSTNSFVSSLASNPVIYFYDTFKNRESSYDLAKVEADYPLIADYLGVENHQHKKLDYLRHESADNAIAEQPNVVMVFLESFAYYKTGLSGNPMNPSPRFDQMANEGISFDRFYVPHGGTARSVFTAMTGLPDIEKQKTSSRNPLVVNQQLIINAFKNHSKHYFLGGSTSWGNIRGLLAHNIPDLQIHEDYQSNSNDIWGISDLHLFEEANQLLREEKEPFFAIIQTSGNHRPYTIPEDNRGFVSIEKDEDELAKMGFRSLADYNAFRFMDHSIGFYYDLIQQESYSNNTIFVFFADHGNNRQAKHMYKGEEALMLTEYHIPLVIYAPEFIKQPQVISTVGSEVDLFPTIADLAGTPYKNTTLGRSLFDKKHHDQRYAFTIMPGAKNRIGLISKDHYFLMNTNGSNKTLHSIFSDTPRQNIMGLAPEQAKKHEELTRGLFETIKYIRLNNKNSPEH
jgi:phosphoglycerol transferase MdoB-like AlkP superfamily enzyme